MGRITKRTVDALAPTDRFEAFLWDDALPGFGVRALRTGVKTYVLRYRTAAGGQRRLALGRHGPLTPDQARNLALQRLGEIAAGRDPSTERREARRAGEAAAAETVAAIGRAWVADQERRVAKGKLRERSLREGRRILDVEIVPRLGAQRFDDLRVADAARLHSEISATRPVLANRTLNLLSQIHAWAAARELTSRPNPCRAVERNEEKRAERVLTRADLAKLGDALRRLEAAGEIPARVGAAVRLIAYTGARPGEVKGLAWAEVDVERRTLRLRDSKTGARAVWLNEPAAAVLRALDRGESEWVFPTPRDPGRPVREFRKPWARLLREARLDHTEPYALRHTFASESEAAGHSILMTSHLLGHSLGRRSMTARYVHHVPAEVRAASERVGRRIAAALDGEGGAAEVISFPGTAS